MTPTQRAIVVVCWAVMTCAWCAVMSGQHEVVVYGAGVVWGVWSVALTEALRED